MQEPKVARVLLTVEQFEGFLRALGYARTAGGYADRHMQPGEEFYLVIKDGSPANCYIDVPWDDPDSTQQIVINTRKVEFWGT